jgi:hypothetical protein
MVERSSTRICTRMNQCPTTAEKNLGRRSTWVASAPCTHSVASAYTTKMAILQSRYFVRLRPDLSPQEASEFRAFAKKPPSGKPPSDLRLILGCARIDLSHHVFAKLTINLDEGAPPIDLWVPHQVILMIGDFSEIERAPVVFTPVE